MAAQDEIVGSIWQGNPTPLVARIRDLTGIYLLKQNLTAITYNVFDLSSLTPLTVTSSGTITISSAVYDTLQQNTALWPIDLIGYNFLFTVPGTAFPLAPRDYRVSLRFLQTDGQHFYGVFRPRTKPILTVPL